MRRLAIAAMLLLASCGGPTPLPSSSSSGAPNPTVVPSAAEPDGAGAQLSGQVAYVGGADPQIYLLDLASGESVQLTHLTADDANLTGSGPLRPALTCGFGPTALRWSPGGERLAFAYGGCDTVVHLVDLEGTLQRVGDGRNPTWSPDGSSLVFEQNYPYLGVSGNESWPLLRVDTTVRDAAPVPLGDMALGLYAAAAAYSPDGTLLAFSGPPPEGGEDPMATAAYVMTREGREVRVVARGVTARGWLPDGRLIVLDPATGRSAALDVSSGDSAAIAGGDPVEEVSPDGWILAAVFEDGGNHVRLYDPRGEVAGDVRGLAPTWSPDGSAFLVNDVEAAVLGVFGTDGSELTTYDLVGPVGGDLRARWRPSPVAP